MNNEQLLKALQRVLAPVHLEDEAQLVARLDALALDKEVFSILWENLAAAVGVVCPRVLHLLEPELRALLRFFYFAFSVGSGRPFPGDAYQNLVYSDERNHQGSNPILSPLSLRKKLLFGFFYIMAQHVPERWQALRYSESSFAPSTHNYRIFENLMKGISALNFVLFVLNRKYRTPLERILCLRLKVAEESATRALNFEMLNRQLVWEGFTELLMSLIPIAQSPLIRRAASEKLLPWLIQPSCEKEKSFTASNKLECRICGKSRPCMPHILVPCGHVFCYVCVAMAMHADQSNRCPFCGTDAERPLRVASNADFSLKGQAST
ncbi:hypothetical protein CCYA_CCYA17G4325 [Cyanidiococcus yangmingshanensis]|nr:hypothetical protein CCYA_CCYA17G4325 [Cyanidiococcus yangmingshanensis]